MLPEHFAPWLAAADSITGSAGDDLSAFNFTTLSENQATLGRLHPAADIVDQR